MEKSNKTFLMLSVFGILFVVFGHMQNRPEIFMNNLFPFYSFHMPLFVFVSGYFFHDYRVMEFIKKKVGKLIIPYFVYRIIYAIINVTLCKLNIIKYGSKLSVYNIFIAPFITHGNQYFFDFSAWFLLALFFVQLIYFFAYRVKKKTKINMNFEWAELVVLIIIAFFSIKLERTGISYTIVRILFLLPFYHFGVLYKEKIESRDKISNIKYFTIVILIQTILSYRGNLTYNLNLLQFNNNYIILFIASLNGIAFGLRISRILAKYIGKNKIINYIGSNTFTIMMNHIFVFFAINLVCYVIHSVNIGILKGFEVEKFRTSLWYVVWNYKNVGINLLYIVLSITIPLCIKYIYENKCVKYLNLGNIERKVDK